MAKVELFATNLHNASHMEWTLTGQLLANEHSAGNIKNITEGGDMSRVAPLVTGLQGPAGILPLADGRILVAETWSGQIKDVSKLGDMSAVAPFAAGLSMPYSMVVAIKNAQPRLFVSECRNYRTSWVTDFTGGGQRTNLTTYVEGLPTVAVSRRRTFAPSHQK